MWRFMVMVCRFKNNRAEIYVGVFHFIDPRTIKVGPSPT